MNMMINRKNKKNVLLGLLFIFAAVFVVIAKLNFWQDMNTFSIIWAGIWGAAAIQGLINLNFGQLFFPLAFILMIFDEQLNIENLTPWTVLLVAFLLTIGCEHLFGNCKLKKKERFNVNINIDEPPVLASDNNSVNVVFNGASKYFIAEDFESGKINIAFGGAEIYFQGENLKNKKAVLELKAAFGGVEIYVPRDWIVIDNCKMFFGGIESSPSNYNAADSNKNILYLEGNVTFGGCEIMRI